MDIEIDRAAAAASDSCITWRLLAKRGGEPYQVVDSVAQAAPSQRIILTLPPGRWERWYVACDVVGEVCEAGAEVAVACAAPGYRQMP